MNICDDLSKLEHSELLSMHDIAKNFITYLNNEIETVEVERKVKWVMC